MFRGPGGLGLTLGNPLRTPDGVIPSLGSKVSPFPVGRVLLFPYLPIRAESSVCPQPSRIFCPPAGKKGLWEENSLFS